MQQTLWSFVEQDAQKLMKRLSRLDIDCITEMEYGKYLNSTLWGRIRDWVVERDGKACSICQYQHYNPNNDGMEVHHRSYDVDTLMGRDDSMLVTLCSRCHHKVEHYSIGTRRTSLQEKDSELQRLICLHRQIVENGLLLEAAVASTARRRKIQLKYVGPTEYAEFYSVVDFAYGLLLGYWQKYRSNLHLPRFTSKEKICQTSGISLIDTSTKVKELCVKSTNGIVELSQPINAQADITKYLEEHIETTQYWKKNENNT